MTTLNPFSTVGADAIRDCLISQLNRPPAPDSFAVFRGRALDAVHKLAPALVWLRDFKGVDLTVDVIELSIELRWIWAFAMDNVLILRNPQTGVETELNIAGELPHDITKGMCCYLSMLPGADTSRPFSGQGCEPARQHVYIKVPYLTGMIDRLALQVPPVRDQNSHDPDAAKS